ncbi:hypothetical protein MASR2M117_19460 [Paludibacter sp.]
MNLVLEKFNYTEDLQKQRELFVECFPENIDTPIERAEHYNWKFHSKPSSDKEHSYEYVAKASDELIGYYAALPYEYVLNGETLHAAMVCDVMTGVKARGKGVFTKMGRFALDNFKQEGFTFSTGYPIRADVIPGHKKVGWSFPFQIPMYGRFIKMNQFLKTRNKTLLIPVANLALFLYDKLCLLLSLSISSKHLNIEHYTSNQIEKIEGLDNFFAEWIQEQTIALNKNTEFLKWRLGAPEKSYHILVLRDKDKIVGYTVFRKVKKEDVDCMGVLDFSILNSYFKVSKLLFKKTVKIAKQENVELILMMMMKHNAAKLKLSRSGFIKTPFPFSFIINPFKKHPSHDILFNENNWSLMWIDSDDL